MCMAPQPRRGRSATDQRHWSAVEFGCWDRWWRGTRASAIALKGPRHRAVLARLIVARGEVVSVAAPGRRPVARAAAARRRRGAHVRQRPAPRARPRAGAAGDRGRRVRAAPRRPCDAWRFEAAVAEDLPAERRLERLLEALSWWRGPAFADARRPGLGAASSGAGWRSCGCSRSRRWRTRGCASAGPARRWPTSTRTSPRTRGARRAGACSRSRWPRAAGAATRSNVLRRAHVQLAEQLGVRAGRAAAPPAAGPPARRRAGRRGRGRGLGAQAAAAYDREVGARARARLESTVGPPAQPGRDRRRRAGRGAHASARGDRRRRGARRPAAHRAGDRRLRRPRDLDALRRSRAGGARSSPPRAARWPPSCPTPRARRCWPRSRSSRAATGNAAARGARGRAPRPRPRRPRAARVRAQRRVDAVVRALRPRAAPRRDRRRAARARHPPRPALGRGARPPDPDAGPRRARRLRRGGRARRRRRPRSTPATSARSSPSSPRCTARCGHGTADRVSSAAALLPGRRHARPRARAHSARAPRAWTSTTATSGPTSRGRGRTCCSRAGSAAGPPRRCARCPTRPPTCCWRRCGA